jgi:thymidylate synthase (FAD)
MNDVKIVALTYPLMQDMGAQDFVAYCARVSNPANQHNTETSERLLRYLVKNQHWSPFEMVNVVMEVNTTRDIARQILRHRSFSFQEFSQRYQSVEELIDEMPLAYREARVQHPTNRQKSIPTENIGVTNFWKYIQEEVYEHVMYNYGRALAEGIAKEQARALLPEGLTPSRLYMNGTLRSWVHYCQLRMGNGTQAEHAALAANAWNALLPHFPALAGVAPAGE